MIKAAIRRRLTEEQAVCGLLIVCALFGLWVGLTWSTNQPRAYAGIALQIWFTRIIFIGPSLFILAVVAHLLTGGRDD